jgi:hypothetical protein
MESTNESDNFRDNDNAEIWETAFSDYYILVGLIVVFVHNLCVIYLGLYGCGCKC